MDGSGQSLGGRTSRKNTGWGVTFAGLGINLALGILYTWSVISTLALHLLCIGTAVAICGTLERIVRSTPCPAKLTFG